MTKKKRVAVRMELQFPYLRHVGIFTGIHKYANEYADWQLIIDDWADHILPSSGNDIPFDGFIGRITSLGAKRAKRIGLPTVNVWYASPAKGLPGVFCDYDQCGKIWGEHLLMRGFKNIGAVYHAWYRASVSEADTINQVALEAGCAPIRRFEWLRDRYGKHASPASFSQYRFSVTQLNRWLDTLQPPIGLYVDGIDLARRVIALCLERGWHVPEDVAIISGENEEVICQRPEPSITSMDKNYEKVGFEAARKLDLLMKAKDEGRDPFFEPDTTLIPPIGIVMRQSTDYHAVDDPLVRRTLRFIDEHLQERLTIDRLADAMLVSRGKLITSFREKLQRGIAEEIQRLRIERVKRALTTTDLPIKQISREAGFASLRTMNDVFRALEGCAPREFREQRKSLS